MVQRRTVGRSETGFVGNFDTGQPQYAYSHVRKYASENAFPFEGKVPAQAGG